jgi:hypothetical protein
MLTISICIFPGTHQPRQTRSRLSSATLSPPTPKMSNTCLKPGSTPTRKGGHFRSFPMTLSVAEFSTSTTTRGGFSGKYRALNSISSRLRSFCITFSLVASTLPGLPMVAWRRRYFQRKNLRLQDSWVRGISRQTKSAIRLGGLQDSFHPATSLAMVVIDLATIICSFVAVVVLISCNRFDSHCRRHNCTDGASCTRTNQIDHTVVWVSAMDPRTTTWFGCCRCSLVSPRGLLVQQCGLVV